MPTISGARERLLLPAIARLRRRTRSGIVLRARRRLTEVALERDRIDLPREAVVRMRVDDVAVGVELDGLGPHRKRLVVGAVPVRVVEDRLDPVHAESA
jgi:hypothetical protein